MEKLCDVKWFVFDLIVIKGRPNKLILRKFRVAQEIEDHFGKLNSQQIIIFSKSKR